MQHFKLYGRRIPQTHLLMLFVVTCRLLFLPVHSIAKELHTPSTFSESIGSCKALEAEISDLQESIRSALPGSGDSKEPAQATGLGQAPLDLLSAENKILDDALNRLKSTVGDPLTTQLAQLRAQTNLIAQCNEARPNPTESSNGISVEQVVKPPFALNKPPFVLNSARQEGEKAFIPRRENVLNSSSLAPRSFTNSDGTMFNPERQQITVNGQTFSAMGYPTAFREFMQRDGLQSQFFARDTEGRWHQVEASQQGNRGVSEWTLMNGQWMWLPGTRGEPQEEFIRRDATSLGQAPIVQIRTWTPFGNSQRLETGGKRSADFQTTINSFIMGRWNPNTGRYDSVTTGSTPIPLRSVNQTRRLVQPSSR